MLWSSKTRIRWLGVNSPRASAVRGPCLRNHTASISPHPNMPNHLLCDTLDMFFGDCCALRRGWSRDVHALFWSTTVLRQPPPTHMPAAATGGWLMISRVGQKKKNNVCTISLVSPQHAADVPVSCNSNLALKIKSPDLKPSHFHEVMQRLNGTPVIAI